MRKDRRQYKIALDAFEHGKTAKARRLLLELRTQTSDERLMIEIDLTLLSCLNQANDHGLILEVSKEGAALASKHSLADIEAVFYTMRAVTLLQKQSSIIHRMKCIKLPPKWFAFALEREQKEYQELEKMLQDIEREAGSLFEKAKSVASKDPKVQARLLFDEARMKSQIFEAKFFASQKLDRLSFKWRLWGMSRKDKLTFLKQLEDIENLYLQSAAILASAGDETGYAFSYYHIALTYRGAWKYQKARFFLKKAGEIAEKHKIKQIQKGIAEVNADLKQLNVSGEDVDYKDFLTKG